MRSAEAPTPKRSEAPTVRQIVGRLTRHPGNLTSRQQLRLKRILTRWPELADLRRHNADFAKMMKNPTATCCRAGRRRPRQRAAPLRNFARNLHKDLDAVTAGLTMPCSSGMVEGRFNRVEFLKRQGYGRADFDLLRRRFFLTYLTFSHRACAEISPES
nr:transposase [Streptomyces inhibens]